VPLEALSAMVGHAKVAVEVPEGQLAKINCLVGHVHASVRVAAEASSSPLQQPAPAVPCA
jgi:hypothetical protein